MIVDSGLKVHRALGPGLLESAYEHCLTDELETRSLQVHRQIKLPITYEGAHLDAGYRLDLMVENSIIIEVKAVEKSNAHPLRAASNLSKTIRMQNRLLMNFHVALFKQGVERLVL